MRTAAGLLGGPAHFLHWGVIQISVANVVVIGLMVLVFVLAILIPMPHSADDSRTEANRDVRD